MRKISKEKICYCGKRFYKPLRNRNQYLISEKAWNKRKYCSKKCSFVSKERQRAIKESLKGIGCTKKKLQHIKKLALYNKGKKRSPFSEEWKKNLSESLKGKTPWNKGKKIPQMSGENHPGWIKDRTKLQRYNDNSLDRASSMYRDWSVRTKKRDKWKCRIINKDCSEKLEAHHILSWREYPKLRYEINNGITLCHAHHPRKRAEEKKLIPFFTELVSLSKVSI